MDHPRIPPALKLRHGLMRVACVYALILLVSLAKADETKLFKSLFILLASATLIYHPLYPLFLRPRLPVAVDLGFIIIELGGYLALSILSRSIALFMPLPLILIKVLGCVICPIIFLVFVTQIPPVFRVGMTHLFSRPVRIDHLRYDHILLGSLTPWHPIFRGESKLITISRTIAGVFVVLSMMYFFLLNIFIDPMRETPTPPVKEIQAFTMPPDVLDSIRRDFVFNVLFTVPTPQIPPAGVKIDMSALLSATSVNVSTADPGDPFRSCSNSSDPEIIDLEQYYTRMPSLTFNCPTDHMKLPGQDASFVEQNPTIVASVDFTKLDGFIMNGSPISSPPLVQVMIGFTNKTMDVLESTSPVPLIPGMNVVGLSDVSIRRKLSHPNLSGFGLFDSYKFFPISAITFMFPDPQATNSSSDIPRGANIATIRILSPNDFSNWKIIQDYRENTFMSGIANIGGLWTSVGGIFAVFFGPSLLQLLFGVKPVSIVGLLHNIIGVDRGILFGYDNLNNELEAERAKKGMLAFVMDYIIDFGPDITHPIPVPRASHGPYASINPAGDNSNNENAIPMEDMALLRSSPTIQDS